SSLGGALPVDGERGANVGVLFNDTTGGKMDFHTAAAISTAVGECRGERTTQVQVTWTNDAPQDAAGTLPESVTGGGVEIDAGDIRTLVAVYGPEGATLRSTDRDGDAAEDAQITTLGTREIVQLDVLLAPGESTTITVSFAGAAERVTRVQNTPMIEEPETTTGDLDCP
ncbi:MAG: hypothetical protein V4703_06230, partial [Actinomycetota bacterium]